MRTTLDIDDDVLAAAKELAAHDRRSAGKVLSDLAREALNGTVTPAVDDPPAIHGFRPLPKRGVIVTNEIVNRIREEEGI